MAKTSADLDRFWAKVDKSGECWVWKATIDRKQDEDPYGQFYAGGRTHRAHRWIYGQLVERLIAGLQIDHLCRNTLCVRPAHLEQVTPRVNTLRSTAPAAINYAKTHCIRGHELPPQRGVKRRCLACERVGRMRRYWAAKGQPATTGRG